MPSHFTVQQRRDILNAWAKQYVIRSADDVLRMIADLISKTPYVTSTDGSARIVLSERDTLDAIEHLIEQYAIQQAVSDVHVAGDQNPTERA